jgi:acetyltransferase-like isoleucine patch superfamily enzyme
MLFGLPADTYLMFVTYLPGALGFYLRARYWSKRLKFFGGNVRIDTGVYFQNPGFIEIKENCWIDKNVLILAGIDGSQREKIVLANSAYTGDPGVVHIGKNVHIGVGCILSGIDAGIYISDDCCLSGGCKLYAFSHHYRSAKDPTNQNAHFGSMASADRQTLMEGAIHIGANTGLAMNCVVLPGAAIAENSFVAVNSVVHHGIYERNSLLNGAPAQKIADRFETNE